MSKVDIPDKVSWRVKDAWHAIPPCSYTKKPFCHKNCPYFYKCYEDEEE
jgi:hypothetical protein